MTGLGYSDVRTHLQSGNVVYSVPSLAISQRDLDVFGYPDLDA